MRDNDRMEGVLGEMERESGGFSDASDGGYPIGQNGRPRDREDERYRSGSSKRQSGTRRDGRSRMARDESHRVYAGEKRGRYNQSENDQSESGWHRRPDRKRRERRQIMLVTCFFLCLFAGLSGYVCYYAATHKQEMINSSYNGRQQVLMAQNTRGRIYSAQGEVLAETQIDEQGNEVRVYPYENLFSHVVGYDTQGKSGIEEQANYYLIQSNAPFTIKATNQVEGLKNPGDSVYTTLELTLQDVASRALGVYQGAIVVTEPSTGRILAMVSKPDFNPSEIPALWEELVADEESTLLLNRATQGLYPPGSTFKIISALEYIRENGLTDAAAYSYQCPGYLVLDGERINCYHGIAHGSVNFVSSFGKSCNSSFVNIGLSLDRDRFINTLNTLMFNGALPLSVPYSPSAIQLTDDTSEHDLFQLFIGQGKTQITPMHLNMITCAIANQGTLMKPYLIDSVRNADGDLIEQFDPSVYGALMSEEEAARLRLLMEEVVARGTATRLKEAGYTAAGKTGSAEFGVIKGDSHAWFTGYAPADNPQICVTIIIEGAGAGGDYAVPVAKRIFDAYLAE